MWLILAFLSAAFLGIYDSLKKKALKDNAVIPILFLNTLFSSLIFLPFIVLSASTEVLDGTIFHVASGGWEVHKYIVLKALIVLSSWVLGYFGMKHLPLTIVGPINATRPVMVLVGALLFFGEQLNVWQWIGVTLAVLSFLLLSRSGKKEGIDFKHDHWIYMIVGAAVMGAISGLYDKYLMAPESEGGVGLDRMMVQSWYNIYQCFMMLVMLMLLWWPKHKETTPFHWDWAIIGVSIFHVLLCPEHSCRHDQHRFYGAPRQRHRVVPLWCCAVPRKEPEIQGYRPCSGAVGHDIPVYRQQVERGAVCELLQTEK